MVKRPFPEFLSQCHSWYFTFCFGDRSIKRKVTEDFIHRLIIWVFWTSCVFSDQFTNSCGCPSAGTELEGFMLHKKGPLWFLSFILCLSGLISLEFLCSVKKDGVKQGKKSLNGRGIFKCFIWRLLLTDYYRGQGIRVWELSWWSRFFHSLCESTSTFHVWNTSVLAWKKIYRGFWLQTSFI